MKTHNRLNKLSMVALLVMAGAVLTPHSASAEDAARSSIFVGQTREIRVAFLYTTADQATDIYTDFKRQAKRACREDSIRPLSFRKSEEGCMAGLMDKVVDKLGRADVAAVHQDRMIQIASR